MLERLKRKLTDTLGLGSRPLPALLAQADTASDQLVSGLATRSASGIQHMATATRMLDEVAVLWRLQQRTLQNLAPVVLVGLEARLAHAVRRVDGGRF